MQKRLFNCSITLLTASLFVLLTTMPSCQAQQPIKTIQHKDKKTTFLLDATEAAQYIVTDQYDNYFNIVLPVEMSIQMHEPLDPNADMADLRSRYKAYLMADVDTFTAKESRWVADVMKQIFETCNSVHPDIFPDSILLIKTKANHYGRSVYYTRGKCIVIPEDIFDKRDKSAFTQTMYHEMFHVYSRLHPDKKRALYSIIGFEPIGLENLLFPSPLSERVLYNPDGIDFAQAITLQLSEAETVKAIPIIYANENGYQKEKKTFFSYLEFNLFKIEDNGDGRWTVVTQDDGLTSTLNIQQIPDFYKQIRDNTTYIIHPDEVLADNFSFIMLDRDGDQASIKFSKEGKKLLKEIEAVLTGGE
jgi:uncharacterized protein YchJ